jgi:hypothetical protein
MAALPYITLLWMLLFLGTKPTRNVCLKWQLVKTFFFFLFSFNEQKCKDRSMVRVWFPNVMGVCRLYDSRTMIKLLALIYPSFYFLVHWTEKSQTKLDQVHRHLVTCTAACLVSFSRLFEDPAVQCEYRFDLLPLRDGQCYIIYSSQRGPHAPSSQGTLVHGPRPSLPTLVISLPFISNDNELWRIWWFGPLHDANMPCRSPSLSPIPPFWQQT